MSPVRRHFWHVVARLKAGSPRPMNSFLNWFMPAGVNRTVGSLGTSTSLGRPTQPLATKKSRNASRSSSVFIDLFDSDGAEVGLERDGALQCGDGFMEVARRAEAFVTSLLDQLAFLDPR